MAQPAEASRIEEMVRAYIAACNYADAGAIASCFGSQAVHYFPSRLKWSGAATIGDNFARMVEAGGYRWTVDQLLVDVRRPDHTADRSSFAYVADCILGAYGFSVRRRCPY